MLLSCSYREKELVGHGTEYHAEGFGSPIGMLKGINLAIEDMGPRDLRAYDIYEGEQITLEFEGNIKVSGEIITGTRNLQGEILLIKFKNCTVTHGETVLFAPEWGIYDMAVGKNYITNVQLYQNGTKTEHWYQVKIPLRDFEKKVNGIQDFRSIRFMRIFMNGFDEEVQLRFAKLELIRGEWRRYNYDLTHPGLSVQQDPNLTTFNIAAVNVEENDQRTPIKYEIPPGITREIDPSQTYQRQLNEQSLVLEVCNLQDGDARAAYKNVQFDVRTYKKLKMFIHAEEVDPLRPLNTNDLTLFVRLGTDFVENYYEYELPMEVTPWGSTTPESIWPEGNNMEIVFDDLLNLKKDRNAKIEQGATGISYLLEYVKQDPANANRKIKVKGSPNLQAMRTIMVGVRNPLKNDPNNTLPDDGQADCAIVWVNELRLTDFVSEGGSAAVGQMQVQVADFATVSASGNYSGINWGSVESRVQERQRNQKNL